MIDLKGVTLVVSGFPRSGTSMMMRVLKFAGFDILTSEQHKESVDPVDPHGVLELDNMKEIMDHPPEWTAGKVIKIVTPYIHLVPPDRPVKVLFMLRSIQDIVVSLMVKRTIWEDDPWNSITNARKHLERLDVPILFVHYNEMMKYPKSTILLISNFLGIEFDIVQAVRGVEEKPREVATFEKKVVDVSKDAFYKDVKDIMVLNDPNYQVEMPDVQGSKADA